ncbi:hypothetical protein A9Q87_10525 [Flavobacteriales bacterium 34_180_T64]|nr:hypothetical protein A9Q87_10525 [Flavobacteriales bacterium 34_180_T64]
METKIIDSLNYKKQFTDYASLSKEIKEFQKRLNHIGYLEHELLNVTKQNDSMYQAQFSLKELYHTIYIYHENKIDANLINLISDTGENGYFEIPIDNLEDVLQLLNTEIANQGAPFSVLQLKNIQKVRNGILSAELGLSNANKRNIDNILIKGYEAFPKSFLKHYLKIRPNQNFNLSKIKDKTIKLNSLKFATQIKDPEVLFTKDSTILYIYVEKAMSNTFDGFIGFGTNSETNKIEFDGYLNLNLTNNLNFGEVFTLYYKSDENEQKTFEINTKLPYLFNSPLGVELQLNIFKKDSSFVSVSQMAKLAFQFDSKNEISVGLKSTNSNNLLEEEATVNVSDYKSNHYLISYRHQNFQNYDPLFPIGLYVDFTAGIGTRKVNTINESQSIFNIDAYKIFNLNLKNSIYAKIKGGLLLSDTYLENEMLRFGGINSLRGFEENSLTADLFGVLNTEYRYRINNSLYVHSIFDAGYFENKISNLKGKLFGFGFGFGLRTKAGLFRFNYSSGKTKNQPFKFSDSKIHLSLTSKF